MTRGKPANTRYQRHWDPDLVKRRKAACRRLGRRIEELGFQPRDVAIHLKVTTEAVHRWFRGEQCPRGANWTGVLQLLQDLKDGPTTFPGTGAPAEGRAPGQATPDAPGHWVERTIPKDQMELEFRQVKKRELVLSPFEGMPVTARVASETFLRPDLMTLPELYKLSSQVNLEILRQTEGGHADE